MERFAGIAGSRILSNLIPVTLAILGVLVANFPVSFFGGHLSPPLLGFMPLYFWAIVRPDLMTPFWAFVLGVLEDLLSGGPPGVWAAAFLAAYALIDRERDMFAGFSGIGALMGFAAAALVTCVTAYAIVCLLYWTVLPLAPVTTELAMTVIVYAFALPILGGIHRRLVGPLRSDL